MSNDNTSNGNPFTVGRLIAVIIAILTARIAYFVNDSIFWAIVDFFFWPFVWVKWLICQDVNMSIIREAFAFFFQ